MDIGIREHVGPRGSLRPLFELAEDSPTELDGYLDAGELLIAVDGDEVVGHLQLTDGATPAEAEVKNMAVVESHRGRGVGRALVEAAVERCRARGLKRLRVATATADVGNLRFYQRLGFRLRMIEHDAFTPAAGYPEGVEVDGIPLRDRVWLDRPLSLS